MNSFKSGFIAIIGRPNVGKSSLLNSLLNTKIAITSSKPETTRSRILGILNKTDEYQLVFVDTPGINEQFNLLDQKINEVAISSLEGNDLIYYVVDQVYHYKDEMIIDLFKKLNTPVYLIVNKIDLLKGKQGIDKIILSYLDKFPFEAVVPVSAKDKTYLNRLIEITLHQLPEDGFKFFPDDYLTNQSEALMISELIREKILNLTEKEVPYAATVIIDTLEYNQEFKTYDVNASIIVERDSQKKILIGKNGEKIKQIGTEARKDINQLLDTKVHLELFVKTKKDWRNNPVKLKSYGIGEY